MSPDIVNDLLYVHVRVIIGEIMTLAKIAAEDLVKALKDESVIAALTSMFESFLNNVLKMVNGLQEENVELGKALVAARQTIDKHTVQLEALEAYTNIDNLVIYELPESYAEAAKATSMDDSQSTFELPPVSKKSSTLTEKTFAEF